MKKIKPIFLVALCIMILTPFIQKTIGLKNQDNHLPLLENIDKEEKIDLSDKYIIGYCQSIEDTEATGIFYYTLKGLEKSGYIEMFDYNFMPYETKSKDLWEFACKNIKSENLIFLEDNYFDIDIEGTDRITKELIADKFDILLTYGTAAGQSLLSDFHNVDVINFASNDPVGAGFVKSKEYSGYENLWAQTDDTRYYRQLKMFYDVIKFKKLGVIRYTDSFRRVLTPEKDIEKLAKEENFEIEYYDFYKVDEIFLSGDIEGYYDEIQKAHEYLANNSDAFYMVVGGWKYSDLPVLLESFYENKIPVFSQFGSVEVENGALMSVGKTSFDEIGDYAASIMTRILAGEKPGNINQVYLEMQSIAYNVSVAEKIDFRPDMEFLIYCNEVYEKKVKP